MLLQSVQHTKPLFGLVLSITSQPWWPWQPTSPSIWSHYLKWSWEKQSDDETNRLFYYCTMLPWHSRPIWPKTGNSPFAHISGVCDYCLANHNVNQYCNLLLHSFHFLLVKILMMYMIFIWYSIIQIIIRWKIYSPALLYLVCEVCRLCILLYWI